MDQLEPRDSLFLDLENDEVQSNIGGLSILEGPAPTLEELIRKIESRLDDSPRYRQRLQFVPLRLTSPVWVDDESFDVHNHLIHEHLPEKAGMEHLRQSFVDFAAEHLDREHPLWQVCVYEGLPDGRWALGWKAHHALVDGIAATELIGLLLDFVRDTLLPARSPEWQPQPPPPNRSVVARTLRGPQGPARPLRDIGKAIRSPRKAARLGRETMRTLLPIGRSIVTADKSPLNGPIGARRRWANAHADLAEIKTIGRAFGGTVNDVVLAAVAGGIRDLLISRGESLDGLEVRSMVPVAMRVEREPGRWCNQVSAVFVDLPVDQPDPLLRLENLREQMERAKLENDHTAGEVLFDLANYLPAPVWKLGEQIAWRVADTQRLMNTITTNVPGPQHPMYCLGREMLELYPFVMLAKNIRTTTAIFSYNGGVYFGVTGDFRTVPDVEVVARGIEDAIAELQLMAAAGADSPTFAGAANGNSLPNGGAPAPGAKKTKRPTRKHATSTKAG
ncbi:MAG: wax ester/triacylglycerol synthase family O-acyltransferase [Actinobacteria bacterium]|nr:wax ester/triacylglycerol synthase family O-acyltransferase [Actinomycetota bacterium]